MSAESPGLKERTVSGAKWNLLNQVSRTATSLFFGVIMARLLSPEDFGLLGMITVFSNFAMILTDFGFGSSLVQHRRQNRLLITSVFWINLLIGVVLALLFAAVAGQISLFYDEPRLEQLVYAVSFHLLFVSLNVVQKNLMIKALNFKAVFLGEAGALFLSAVVSIALALSGAGYWALILQIVFNSFGSMAVFWVLSDYKPDFSFSRKRVSLVMRYSLNLLGTKALNYWMRNLDNLLIAKFIGSAGLGIYSMAYRLLMFPLQNISGVLARVFFSAYSKIQKDPEKIKKVHLKLLRSVVLVSFPLMALLAAGVENFVYGLLGEKWAELIPLLYLFIPISLLQTINRMNGTIYLALGKTDIQFKVGLYLNTMIVISFIVGLKWGVLGVAAAYTVATCLNFYPAFYFANRLIGLKLTEALFQFKETIFASAVAAAVSYGIGHLAAGVINPLPLFFLQSGAGGALFLILTLLLQRDMISELWGLAFGRAKGTEKGHPKKGNS